MTNLSDAMLQDLQLVNPATEKVQTLLDVMGRWVGWTVNLEADLAASQERVAVLEGDLDGANRLLEAAGIVGAEDNKRITALETERDKYRAVLNIISTEAEYCVGKSVAIIPSRKRWQLVYDRATAALPKEDNDDKS